MFFTKLDLSLDIYFSFASLEDFLGPDISAWKFWPKIQLNFVYKTLGPGGKPLNFIIVIIIFFIFCRYDFITKWTK